MRFIRLLLLLFILSSCTRNEENLHHAERLLESHPDSALLILQQIDTTKHFDNAHRALYGILMFKALDKNDLTLQPDTLINFSINYYTHRPEGSRLANALFYKGRMYKYANEHTNAISFYLQALDVSEKSDDYALLGRIYSDLGEISIKGENHNKAEAEYRKAMYFFEKCNFNDYIVNSLIQIGKIKNHKKEFDSANFYCRKAFERTEIEVEKGRCLQDIGQNFYNQEQYDSAMYYFRASLQFQYYKNNRAICFYMMGDIFFELNSIDSSSYYVHEALKMNPGLATKRECYRVLTNIEYQTLDNNRDPYYINLYQKYNDSIHALELKNNVATVEQLHEKSKIAVKSQKRYWSTLIISVIASMIGMLVTFWIYRWQKKEKQQLVQQQLERSKQHRKKLIHNLQSKIALAKQEEMQHLKKAPVAEKVAILINIYNKILKLDHWDNFLLETESMTGELTKELNKKPYGLNNKELKWCYLQLLGIEQADLLTLIDCKPVSYSKFKQRLAQKLQLADATMLHQFLHADDFIDAKDTSTHED